MDDTRAAVRKREILRSHPYMRPLYSCALSSDTAGCFNQPSAISGTWTRANIQLSNRETASTMNRSRIYHPAVSGRYTGKNASMAIRVAPNSGIAVFADLVIASARFSEFEIDQNAVDNHDRVVH